MVPFITYSTSYCIVKKIFLKRVGGVREWEGAGCLLSFIFLKIAFCFSLLVLMTGKFINVPLAILIIYDGGVLSFISDTLNR